MNPDQSKRVGTLIQRRRRRGYSKLVGPREQRDRLTQIICYIRTRIDALELRIEALTPGDPAREELESRRLLLVRRLQSRLRERDQLVRFHGLRTLAR